MGRRADDVKVLSYECGEVEADESMGRIRTVEEARADIEAFREEVKGLRKKYGLICGVVSCGALVASNEVSAHVFAWGTPDATIQLIEAIIKSAEHHFGSPGKAVAEDQDLIGLLTSNR